MGTNQRKKTKNQEWVDLNEALRTALPHFHSWVQRYEDVNEIRIKFRTDGTFLAIAKGYDSDGAPIVCFGVGYDVAACLLAIDSTIQGNRWRVDKPYKPGK